MKSKVDKFSTELEDFPQREALVKKFPDLLEGYTKFNEDYERLDGLVGLTRGTDIHVAYREVLGMKRYIDDKMKDVAGIIGKDFTRIEPPKLEEVSSVEENHNKTGSQEPPEVLKVGDNHNKTGSQEPPEPQQKKRNAFGILVQRGPKYLSESQAK